MPPYKCRRLHPCRTSLADDNAVDGTDVDGPAPVPVALYLPFHPCARLALLSSQQGR